MSQQHDGKSFSAQSTRARKARAEEVTQKDQQHVVARQNTKLLEKARTTKNMCLDRITLQQTRYAASSIVQLNIQSQWSQTEPQMDPPLPPSTDAESSGAVSSSKRAEGPDPWKAWSTHETKPCNGHQTLPIVRCRHIRTERGNSGTE